MSGYLGNLEPFYYLLKIFVHQTLTGSLTRNKIGSRSDRMDVDDNLNVQSSLAEDVTHVLSKTELVTT